LLLASFKRKECDRFFLHLKENLKQSNKTFNKYRGYLSTVLNFYIEHQELEIKNPVKKVQHLTVEESDMHEPVQPEHLQKIKQYLLQTGDRQMYLFIGFLYYTFTRPHEEIRLLKVGDIREKTIFIPAKRAKSNRGEHISIPAGLEALITEFELRKYPSDSYVFTLDGEPGIMHVGEKYFYRKHQCLLAALDLDGLNYSLYGYKHTGALELYAMTKDILAVKTHCRHTSSTQTDTYLRKYGAMLNEKAILMVKF
jgi:integrase